MATRTHQMSYKAYAFGRTKATKIIEQSGVAMKRDGIFDGLQRMILTGKSEQIAHAVALINQAEQDHLMWRERKKDSERKKREVFGAMPTPPSETHPTQQKFRRLSQNPYNCLADESDDEVSSSSSANGNKKSNRRKYIPLQVELHYSGNIRDRKRELFENRRKRKRQEEFPSLHDAVLSQADQSQGVTSRTPILIVLVSALKGDWASVVAPSVESPKTLKEDKPKTGLVALTKRTLETLPMKEVVQEHSVYKKTFKHLSATTFSRPNEWDEEGNDDVFYANDEPYESYDPYWAEDY